MISSEIFINLAYGIYFIAFLLRDMLLLRLTVICSCVCLIIYGYYTQSTPMMLWNLSFLLINLFQIIILILERRPVVLDEELEEIYLSVFRVLTRREFYNLWKFGESHDLQEEAVCREGKAPAYLNLITGGEFEVIRAGERLTSLSPFQFIGEMSFFNQSVATADVRATGKASVHRRSHAQLDNLKNKWPIIHERLLVILGQDLTKKIAR